MKILLVGINSKYIHTNIAVQYIKEYSQKQAEKDNVDMQIEILEANINQPKEKVLSSIVMQNADVVAFSCYIFNIDFVKQLICDLKIVTPNAKIVLGGVEVSYENEELLNLCDNIICGEGEIAFYDLAKSYAMSKQSSNNNKNCETIDKVMKCNKVVSLDKLGSFYTQKYLQENKDKVIYYESSRGCPFSCAYCMSGINEGVRFKNIEIVKKDLLNFMQSNVKEVKFIDRTFNCNLKHSKQIWEFIAKNSKKYETLFHFEIGADIFDDECFEILGKVDCGKIEFEIGLQSFNEKTLKESSRKMDSYKICKNVEKLLNLKNIHIHTDLIAGLPYEDFQSFKNSFNVAMNLKTHYLQVGFLKVLKGSNLKNQIDNGEYVLNYSKFSPYQILSSEFISYQQLEILKLVEEAVSKFYNDVGFAKTIDYLSDKFVSQFDFYMCLGEFLKNGGYLSEGIHKLKKYQILCDLTEKLVDKQILTSEEKDIAKNLLRFDYFSSNKSQSLPPSLFVEYSEEIKKMNKENKNASHFEFDFNPNNLSDKTKCVAVFNHNSRNPVCQLFECNFLVKSDSSYNFF